MVYQVAVPIATAVGEFAAPYLIKEATKLGIKKFIQTYGSTAFQAISTGVVGGMIEQVAEPVDLQKEKLFGIPVSRITGQEQVYSDIEEPTKVKPLEYIPEIHGGKPLPPIEQEYFPAKTEVEPVQEGFKKPEKIEPLKGLEIPPQEIKMPPGIQKAEPLGTDILFNKEYTDEEFYNESIKQKKGSRFLDRIHNDDVFKDLNFPNDTYEELEAEYTGDINDLGDARIAQVFLLPYTNLYEDYFEDYKQRLADIAEEELGKEFFVYRVMHKNEALNWFKSGDLPLIKETVYDEETGEETRKIFKLEGIGGEHGMVQEAMGFSLNPYTALGFRHLTAFSGVDVIPEKDLVIVKAKVAPTDIVMRGNKSEQEVVFNVGELRAGKELTLYDFKEVKDEIGKQYALTENLDYITPDVGTDLAAPGIGHNQPPSPIEEQTDDLVTKTKPKEYKGELTEVKVLDKNLMDFIAKYAGTPQEMRESIKLPQSHQKKIYIQLGAYLEKNYPTKLTKKDMEHEDEALFYMASVLYSAYYRQDGKVPDNMIVIADDIGIPMAVAEIEVRADQGKRTYYPKRKKGSRSVIHEPAIYIEQMGSLNAKATEKIMEAVEKLADINDIRYVVAEDLTSELALRAIQLRGFKPAKKGFFEGDIITTAKWRGGREVKQKNMVLDLGERYATTQEEIDKEFEKERIQEQTEKLTKK